MQGKRPPPALGTTDETVEAVRIQNSIGWNLAMRGILAEQWAAIQETTDDGVERPEHTMGDAWSAKVGAWLMTQSRLYWDGRNNVRQKQPSPEVTDKSRATVEMEAKVRHLYSRIDELAVHDQGLFHIPLEDRLRSKTKYLAAWWKSTTIIVNRAAAIQRAKDKRQPDIREVFAAQKARDVAEGREAAAAPTETSVTVTRTKPPNRHKQPILHLHRKPVANKTKRTKKIAQTTIQAIRRAPMAQAVTKTVAAPTAATTATIPTAATLRSAAARTQRTTSTRAVATAGRAKNAARTSQPRKVAGQPRISEFLGKKGPPAARTTNNAQQEASNSQDRAESNGAMAVRNRYASARRPKFRSNSAPVDCSVRESDGVSRTTQLTGECEQTRSGVTAEGGSPNLPDRVEGSAK